MQNNTENNSFTQAEPVLIPGRQIPTISHAPSPNLYALWYFSTKTTWLGFGTLRDVLQLRLFKCGWFTLPVR